VRTYRRNWIHVCSIGLGKFRWKLLNGRLYPFLHVPEASSGQAKMEQPKGETRLTFVRWVSDSHQIIDLGSLLKKFQQLIFQCLFHKHVSNFSVCIYALSIVNVEYSTAHKKLKIFLLKYITDIFLIHFLIYKFYVLIDKQAWIVTY